MAAVETEQVASMPRQQCQQYLTEDLDCTMKHEYAKAGSAGNSRNSIPLILDACASKMAVSIIRKEAERHAFEHDTLPI